MYSKLKVLSSAAGYYIGRQFTDAEGVTEPGTRESDYYPSYEVAENLLKEGFITRMNAENMYAFLSKEIDSKPGTFVKGVL